MSRIRRLLSWASLGASFALALAGAIDAQDLAVRGDVVHTMAGDEILDGVVLVAGGKIVAVGAAADIAIPAGLEVRHAAVVTPGLIDAHSVVGLAGWLNYEHDQDQLEPSEPIQPELRAIDSYNPREPLIEYLRGYGVTTIHTGHAPGAAISGQTMVAKTRGTTVKEATLVPEAMLAATLGDGAVRGGKESPGTRAKAVALLRAELVAARGYLARQASATAEEPVERSLRLETLGRVLTGDLPLLVTAHRAHDILTALRLAKEFGFRLVLDGASEAYLVADEILAAKVPVIVHPTMARAVRETENLSFETPGKLRALGVPVALQSGYESYVPKTRVVLFEAGVAAANGMAFEEALALVTIDAARVLGLSDRIGSLAPGMDADLALYDGDPFEYTTHCVGVVIDGIVVSDEVR